MVQREFSDKYFYDIAAVAAATAATASNKPGGSRDSGSGPPLTHRAEEEDRPLILTSPAPRDDTGAIV